MKGIQTSVSGSRGQTDVDMKKSSAFWAALCCHPCLGMPGPAASNKFASGRSPSAKASNLGRGVLLRRPQPPGGRQGVRQLPHPHDQVSCWAVPSHGSCSTHLPNLTTRNILTPMCNGKLPTSHVWLVMLTYKKFPTHCRMDSERASGLRVHSGETQRKTAEATKRTANRWCGRSCQFLRRGKTFQHGLHGNSKDEREVTSPHDGVWV